MAETARIRSIETVRFSAPLTAPVRYGKIERTRSASVLVRLVADNGLVGYGEACAVPQLTGESAESIVSLVDLYLNKLIPGTDALNWRRSMAEIRKRFPRSFVALAAVETAFVDLVGKMHGVPAWALLGGQYRERVELCASISWDPDAGAMAEDAAEQAASHRVLKVYVGPDTLDTDMARLRAVRSAVRDEVRIMLDVKGLWAAHTAIAVAPMLRDQGVFLVEQPVWPEDRAGARAVTRVYRERFDILTAADESIETPVQAAAIAENEAFSALNLGITKMGGAEPAVRATHVAEAYHIPVLVGSFAELGIATAAGIHFAATIPELVAPAYLSGPKRFTEPITSPSLLPENGHVAVPTGPGLGIEVDEARIAVLAAH